MKDRWLRVRKDGAEVRSWLERHSGVLTLAWIVIVIVLTIWFWLAFKSNGEVLRNYALFAAAAIGLPLAFWRSCVAHKQANSQSKQADTAERGHNNERFQKGADMLGSSVMTTRMGGVYALERVAQEHPHEYHVQIMKLLCAFLRHQAIDGGEEGEAESKELRMDLDATAHDPPGDGGIIARKELRLDLDAAAQAIGKCRKRLAKEERLAKTGRLKIIEGDFLPNLVDANLAGANLSGANLSGANLTHADLTHANLSDADLSDADLTHVNLTHASVFDANLTGAHFWGANLSDASLAHANLTGAHLSRANLSGARLLGTNLFLADLSGADFDQVKYLWQVQLDKACQHPCSSPPMHLPDDLTWDDEAAKARWPDHCVL